MNTELLRALFAWSAANVMPVCDAEEGCFNFCWGPINCGYFDKYRLIVQISEDGETIARKCDINGDATGPYSDITTEAELLALLDWVKSV